MQKTQNYKKGPVIDFKPPFDGNYCKKQDKEKFFE